jgi:hypothetical protein
VRPLDEPTAPKRKPFLTREWSRREALELYAAGEAAQLRPLDPEEQSRFRLRPGRHDEQAAAARPCPQPPAPNLGVAPVRRCSCLDHAQHGELGPVQVAEDRQRGEAARGGLVRRREMVQMEQVGPTGTGAREHVDPGSDEPPVGGIANGGKDAIGRIRAILVGRRKRHRRSQRHLKPERGRVVERVDIDPAEEARRVGRLAPPSQRARGQPQLPPRGRQYTSERARDLRRAAAREEEERRQDESARRRRTDAARGIVGPGRISHPHGSIIVPQPHAVGVC